MVSVWTGEYAVDTTAAARQWSGVETVVTMTRQTRNCGHYEMVLRQESGPVVHYTETKHQLSNVTCRCLKIPPLLEGFCWEWTPALYCN